MNNKRSLESETNEDDGAIKRRKYTLFEKKQREEKTKAEYRKFQDDMMTARGCFESFGPGYNNNFNLIVERLFYDWCDDNEKDENNLQNFNQFVLSSDTMKTPRNQKRLRRIRDIKTQEFYYQYYLWEYYFREQTTKNNVSKSVAKAKRQWERNFKRYNLEILGVENNHVHTLGGKDCNLTKEIIDNGHLCTWFLERI